MPIMALDTGEPKLGVVQNGVEILRLQVDDSIDGVAFEAILVRDGMKYA